MGIYKKALKVFYKNYDKFIGYQLLTSLILLVLLMPLFTFVFNGSMRLAGYDYITNGLLQKFLISPAGIFMVLFSLLLGFVLVVLELGGLIVIAQQALSGSGGSRYVDIVYYAFKRLKYLFGLDGVIIVIYFIVLAPLIDAEYSIGQFDRLKIPGFVMDTIARNLFYTSILAVLFLGIMYLSFKWMFAIHILLLDRLENKRILKKASLIFENNKRVIFKATLLHSLLDLLIASAITIVFLLISILILKELGTTLELMVSFGIFLWMTLFFVFSNVFLILSVIRMTLMFNAFSATPPPVLQVRSVGNTSVFNRFISNKVVLFLSFIIMFLGVFLYTYGFNESLHMAKYDVDITAHRGSSLEAPENTLSAVKKAVENGADFVEIDVQLTKDKEIILLHDETFKRVSGVNRRPDELTLSEIRELDAGKWFDPSFEGEKIPSLKEIMDYSRGKIQLNIELKGSSHSPDIIEAVKQVIINNEYRKLCVVTSLELKDLERLEALSPEIDTGYIVFIALGDLSKMPVDFYSVEASNVTEAFVEKAHEQGRQVHVWTINDESIMEEMLDLGVDNMITDNDVALKGILDKRKANRGDLTFLK